MKGRESHKHNSWAWVSNKQIIRVVFDFKGLQMKDNTMNSWESPVENEVRVATDLLKSQEAHITLHWEDNTMQEGCGAEHWPNTKGLRSPGGNWCFKVSKDHHSDIPTLHSIEHKVHIFFTTLYRGWAIPRSEAAQRPNTVALVSISSLGSQKLPE